MSWAAGQTQSYKDKFITSVFISAPLWKWPQFEPGEAQAGHQEDFLLGKGGKHMNRLPREVMESQSFVHKTAGCGTQCHSLDDKVVIKVRTQSLWSFPAHMIL